MSWSMTRTSGRSLRAKRNALIPSRTTPTTSRSASAPMRYLRFSRIDGWSSAMTMRSRRSAVAVDIPPNLDQIVVDKWSIAGEIASHRDRAVTGPLAFLELQSPERTARYYFVLRDRARVFAGRIFARLCPTAAFTIALRACSSSFSFRETSIARDLPKSCALKSFFGSGRLEPAENASLTRSLRMIPTHICPSCDQTAEPSGLLGRFHFTSSAISGSASRTILRSFASIAPRQSRVFAINSSTGPARLMSAPHSFVYRVSAVPAAHGADVIASRRAAIDARVASDQIQLSPTKGFSVTPRGNHDLH